MVRISRTVFSGTLIVCAAIGCAHFVETQAINHFTAALDQGDLDKLRESTSPTFANNALRNKNSPKILKIVDPHPEEKILIVKVRDETEAGSKVTVKKVDVTTGRTHRKLTYDLVRDPKTGKWVVDDIIIKQRRNDVRAERRVSEQMDLLLVVQDFLDAWRGGKREAVQAVLTASFAKTLAELPDSYLKRLTKKVAGERISPDKFLPEATIDGNDALVKLQRAQGQGILVLTVRQTKKGWKVSDAAVESRKDKDHLPSVKKMATAIKAVVDFLKAYQNDDKKALQSLAAETFYERALRVANLKVISLPSAKTLGDKDEVKIYPKGGEYLIQREADTVKISLVCPAGVSEDPTYVVDAVTLFDAKQEKSLAALCTAQPKMQLFVNALRTGNLELVKQNSTADLNSKIWNRLGPVSMAEILPPEIELELPTVEQIDYRGAMIQIDVRQGSRELTYVMRDWSGDVNVDDILMPVVDRPNSMKQTMQSLLPIRLLAVALREAPAAAEGQDKQMQILRSVTSHDFNRVVWNQATRVPESACGALINLDAPLSTITETPTGQVVVLGDGRFGARIELARERELLFVDRMWLMTGSQSDPPELKNLLRDQLAKHGPRGPASDPMSAEPIATDPPDDAEGNSLVTAPPIPTQPTPAQPTAAQPTVIPASFSNADPPADPQTDGTPSKTVQRPAAAGR